MEKIIKTVDMIDEIFDFESFTNLKLSNVQKVNLIRKVFKVICNEVDAVERGKLKIQGLGNFIVKNVKMEPSGDIIRRVVFVGNN